jgi:hypothetical protein
MNKNDEIVIRQALQSKADQLAAAIGEISRSITGIPGPAKALKDFPPNIQTAIIWRAAQELANEFWGAPPDVDLVHKFRHIIAALGSELWGLDSSNPNN